MRNFDELFEEAKRKLKENKDYHQVVYNRIVAKFMTKYLWMIQNNKYCNDKEFISNCDDCCTTYEIKGEFDTFFEKLEEKRRFSDMHIQEICDGEISAFEVLCYSIAGMELISDKYISEDEYNEMIERI